MFRRSLFFAVLLTAFCLGATARAAEDDVPVITVRKQAGQIDLVINPLAGPEGAAATKILTDDLNMAGPFAVRVGGGSATYTARGQAGGSGLEGTLVGRGGDALVNKTYSGPTRTAAHQFADDIVFALTKQHGIAGGKIAFIGTRTGHKEVYTCDTDGGNLRELTNDANISVGPALSPDGRRLAYTGYKSGYPDVYVINLATGNRDRVVRFPGTNTGAAFSPDGSRLALSCSKDGNPELYTVGADGGGARRLHPHTHASKARRRGRLTAARSSTFPTWAGSRSSTGSARTAAAGGTFRRASAIARSRTGRPTASAWRSTCARAAGSRWRYSTWTAAAARTSWHPTPGGPRGARTRGTCFSAAATR